MATIKNIRMFRGDQYNGFQFQCKFNEVVQDISGLPIKCQIRKDTEDGDVVVTREVGTGMTIVDGPNGWGQFDPIIWSGDAGTFFFDIKVTYPVNGPRTHVKGTLDAEQNVTEL
jgi:hypothetical protein